MLTNINPPVVFRANNPNLKPGVWKQWTLCHVPITCLINLVNTEPWNHREWLCTLFWSKKSFLPTLLIFTGVSLFSTLSPAELLIGSFSHLYPSFMIEVMQIKLLFLSFWVRCVLWYLVIRSKAFKIALTLVPDLCLYWYLPPVSVAGCLVSSLQTVSLHHFIPPLLLFEAVPGNYSSSTHTLSLSMSHLDILNAVVVIVVFMLYVFRIKLLPWSFEDSSQRNLWYYDHTVKTFLNSGDSVCLIPLHFYVIMSKGTSFEVCTHFASINSVIIQFL